MSNSVQFVDLTQEDSNKRKFDVIDLDTDKESVSSHYRSSEDDDVIIVEPEGKESVCFGMVESIVRNAHIDAIHKEFGSGTREIPVILAPYIDNGVTKFKVLDTNQRIWGDLDSTMAALFAPLIGLGIEFHAYLPKVNFNNYAVIIHILVNGPDIMGGYVGKHFLAVNIFFRRPVSVPIYPYKNPQQIYDVSGSNLKFSSSYSRSINGVNYSVTETSAYKRNLYSEQEAKSAIQAVYDNLTAAEDLGEMEPSSDLVTNLYKHQRQALFFMFQKEQPVDFTDQKKSLWVQSKSRKYKNIITNEERDDPPRQSLGGILADDMGLGKTLEVIALILANRAKKLICKSPTPVKQKSKPDPFGFVKDIISDENTFVSELVPSKSTLIICPLSTVSNWEDQFAAHVKKETLSVLIFHGPGRNTDPHFVASHDIVITTYNVLALEFARAKRANKFEKTDTSASLQSVYWHRVVLDEAHAIKDSNTVQAKAAFALNASIRWCLTGTPIQNKLDDLYSLIKFIGIEPFDVKANWSQHISKPIKFSTSDPSLGVSRLQTLMKSITLRRTKDQKIDGKSILDIPPKYDDTVILELDPSERALYDKMHQRAKEVLNGLQSSGTLMKNYVHVLEMILRLRQICAHPLLCTDYDSKFEMIEREISLSEDAGFSNERALYLYGLLKDAGDEFCSNCNIFAESPIISRCGHLYCSKCGLNLKKQPHSICSQCASTLSPNDFISVSQEIEEDEPDDLISEMQTSLGVSTKTAALVENLRLVNESSEIPVKSIVFSQWTKMLDLIEKPLREAGLPFVRLDGKMRRSERVTAMERLRTDPNIRVMLVSLKAGGQGLNLTSASRIYLMEPYWNPAVEQQAIDRVHRLGQKKTVQTIRFIAKGTIEENIVALQQEKMKLAQLTFNEDKRSKKESLQKQRMADLASLFK